MSATPDTIECPQCGSTFVEYLIDPEAHDIVRGTRGVMLSCKICNHIFSISPKRAREIDGAEAPGEQIQADRPCPSCGYDLKTLTIGHRCPECGETITTPTITQVPQGKARPIDLLVVAGIVLAVIWGAYSRTRISILSSYAAACLLIGGSGLLSRSVVIGRWPFSHVATGWRATLHNLSWVFLGLGLAVLALLGWLRIL